MKRWIFLLLLSLLLSGCARQEEPVSTTVPTSAPIQTELSIPTTEPREAVSLNELNYIEFRFNSGAGAWGTVLHISPDGSFSGNYHDSNMGEQGEGYPNGSVYSCDFTGRFSQPEQIDACIYSLRIETLQYEKEPGTEEIREGVRYSYTAAHGLTGTEEMLLYLPGAPLDKLPETYRYWCSATLYGYEGSELPHYGLYNPAQEHGFYGVDILENVRIWVQDAEKASEGLDVWLETNITQADMNLAAQDRYLIWDNTLNSLWAVLKEVLPKDTMEQLTREELAWIEEKEAAVEAAGAEVEGGSIYPAVVNGTAARLTRERVYELLEYLP